MENNADSQPATKPYRLVKLAMGSEEYEEYYSTKEEAFAVFLTKTHEEHEAYLIHRGNVLYGKKGDIGQVIQRYIGKG